MTSHDQLFKDLFEAFFGDLVRLVVPWLAARTRPEGARFLRDELFVDLPAGASRRPGDVDDARPCILPS